MSCDEIVGTLNRQGHNFSFKQVPKEVFAALFPGAAEGAETFRYFQLHTYLGSDWWERIALANKIARATDPVLDLGTTECPGSDTLSAFAPVELCSCEVHKSGCRQSPDCPASAAARRRECSSAKTHARRVLPRSSVSSEDWYDDGRNRRHAQFRRRAERPTSSSVKLWARPAGWAEPASPMPEPTRDAEAPVSEPRTPWFCRPCGYSHIPSVWQ
jgi:hypothetical protein